MKMPYVLSRGTSIQPVGVMSPTSLKISLKENGESTVAMTLMEGTLCPSMSELVMVFYPNGNSGVYTVKKLDHDIVGRTITLQLAEFLKALDGQIAWGEFYANDMGGSGGTVSIGTAMSFLLSKQSQTWFTMGTCEPQDSQGWSHNNVGILSGIKSMMDAVQFCYLEPDYSVFPSPLHLRSYSQTPTIELRLNRNMKGIKITEDSSSMYTRCYPLGKGNATIETVNGGVAYLENNVATYGLMSEVINDGTIKDKNLLKAWAQKQLAWNSYPAYTATIDALDIYQLTGETMDKFQLGKMARVIFEDTTFIEHIAAIEWKDCIKDEYSCMVTIARELKTLTNVMNKKSGGGGGGSKKGDTDNENDKYVLGNNISSAATKLSNALSGSENHTGFQFKGYTTKWASFKDADGNTITALVKNN